MREGIVVVDLAVLYPTTTLCRADNDFMADWCKADPRRRKAVAHATGSETGDLLGGNVLAFYGVKA